MKNVSLTMRVYSEVNSKGKKQDIFGIMVMR